MSTVVKIFATRDVSSKIIDQLDVDLHQSMVTSNGYDYSGMFHFIKEFRNPFLHKPFIIEMEENYGLL
jgi:hypothetical protein